MKNPSQRTYGLSGEVPDIVRIAAPWVKRVYVDDRMSIGDPLRRGQILVGPCDTVAGRLEEGDALIHPSLAAAIGRLGKIPSDIKFTYPYRPREAAPVSTTEGSGVSDGRRMLQMSSYFTGIIGPAATALCAAVPGLKHIYLDPRMSVGEVWVGPCNTASGPPLVYDEATIHPALASDIRRLGKLPPDLEFIYPPDRPREAVPVSTIDQKTYVTKRVEWHVPTGTYGDTGADWTEIMKAINYATNYLKNQGKLDEGREPAMDQIKVIPHDEHVVIRVVLDEEQKK